jgi:hypothetical protein
MENSLLFLLIFSAGFLIWLIILSVLLFNLTKKNNHFFNVGAEDIKGLLDSVVSDNKKFNKRSEKVEQGLDEIAHVMKKSFQKIGLIRYNPFKDTGGDMSFSIALLDLEDSGIVITSIHGRGADRVYAKSLQHGKSQHNLSAEEIEAIKKAME